MAGRRFPFHKQGEFLFHLFKPSEQIQKRRIGFCISGKDILRHIDTEQNIIRKESGRLRLLRLVHIHTVHFEESDKYTVDAVASLRLGRIGKESAPGRPDTHAFKIFFSFHDPPPLLPRAISSGLPPVFKFFRRRTADSFPREPCRRDSSVQRFPLQFTRGEWGDLSSFLYSSASASKKDATSPSWKSEMP